MINYFFKNKYFNQIRLLTILSNDIFLLFVSLNVSYYLRVEYFIKFNDIINVFLISTSLYLLLFFLFKIYLQYFRFFRFNSSQLYLKIFAIYTFLFGSYVLIQNQEFIPRSLSIIFPLTFFLLIIFNRFLIAKIFEQNIFFNKKNIIIFGLNYNFINPLFNNSKIICFVDDKLINTKRKINGINIITSSEFNKKYKNYNFNLILVENDKTFNKSRDVLRRHIFDKKILVQRIISGKNDISTEPYFDFNYFFNRKNKINPINEIYKSKNILITGAAGSIGSNIVFQLLKTKFNKLILLDNSEFNLYKLNSSIPSNPKIKVLLKNYNDVDQIDKLLSTYKIDIIFHAAAYKHVPLIEFNPFSSIKNNFLDTFDFMKVAIKAKVSFFCLISTDKAVRPTNIMGASKRLAELGLRYLSALKNHHTKFCAVRFGNVINSSGSVLPLFIKQIKNNESVTLTHKKITRYFMKIEEAANLVLNVKKVSNGGEIFLLDMGEPIKLYDLAKLLIQFSGKRLKSNGIGDIDIKIIGLRKGEKLYEELLINNDSKPSKINYIYESIEKNYSKNEILNLFKVINQIYKFSDFKKLKQVLKNKFIGYQIK